MITPVILSGGTGSRLWPLSRSDSPKQFLALHGDEPMIVETVRRTCGPDFAPAIVVAGEAHRFHVAACMAGAGLELAALILEPAARSTAPAIALAALQAIENRQNAEDASLILCCPADHVIGDVPAFLQAIKAARAAAENGSIVTFGITPSRPETGFGYIRKGAVINADATADPVYRVDSFVEKPDKAKADTMLADGLHLWNAGIFLMRADVYLTELEAHAPAIASAARNAMAKSVNDLDFIRPDIQSFENCPSLSIDYAVMEKTSLAAVIPVDPQWSDIGSWDALFATGNPDEHGVVSRGDVITHGVTNAYLRGSNRMIACVGVSNIAVVDTPDAVLVVGRDQAQDVKHIFDRLKSEGRRETVHHTHVDRPWGSFDTLALGDRFQVKRIVVKPGGILSLQKHHHRAEHWVVVAGTARVTVGESVSLLSENQSTYIALGEVHRLENPGKVPAVLIEVQTGSYLGEDDIIRLEDLYNREAVPKDAKTA
jgi:mannose-1-phosphate guanylyltransferase/mannose-6-phosphate isomerase